MKKLKSLGRSLSKTEQKKIMGGDYGSNDSCNAYCGTGSGYTCNTTCLKCEDAGNGRGSGPGQDKMCFI